MSFGSSVPVAFFCMFVVFMVLVGLWGAIALFTKVLQWVEKRGVKRA